MSKNIGNVAGGYKAWVYISSSIFAVPYWYEYAGSSIANPRVSEGAREHARDELGQIQSHENASAGDERHDANVKRGLKA